MKRLQLYGILLFLLFSLKINAQVQVEQQIDSVAIMIGEQAHINLSVSLPKSSQVILPEIKERGELSPGLEVITVSPPDTFNIDNGFIKVSENITITAFEESVYAIPPFSVKVDGKEYKGNSLALKVFTMEVDTLHPNQFFPPKGVQDNPFWWGDWNTLFWLSMVVLLLVALLYYLYARLKQNKPIISRIKIIKHIPAHQKALSAIEKIKEEKIAYNEDQKAYYTRLTDTLRQYIEERFGFNAMEMTSDEIICSLQKVGDNSMLRELKDLFSTADLVKFAKYSTLVNENDANLLNAVRFIDTTKIEGQPTEEKIVPQLSSDDKRRQTDRNITKLLMYLVALAIAVIIVYVVYKLYRM